MNVLPSLKQLRYLQAIAQQLNFTRAAESCCVSQSALSTGLRELESTLGTQLVEHDRQTVLMTPLGLELANRARDILGATQDLVEQATKAQEPMSGPLRLGVIPTIAPFLLPPVLNRLHQHYPQLRLALREDLTANLLLRLADGQLDFALIALPYETENLRIEPLFDDPLWLIGHPDDPVLKSKTVDPSPALSERLLLLEEGHCLRDHALYACGNPHRPKTDAIEATSLLTLVHMVEAGLGIGLVPEMAVNSGLTDRPNLLARPMNKPAPSRTIALATRRSSPRLAELQALAELVRENHRQEKNRTSMETA